MAKKDQAQTVGEDIKVIVPAGQGTKKTFSVKLGKEAFAMQEFCNYKAMLVLEVLGEMGEKFNLTPLLSALMSIREGEDSQLAWGMALTRLLPQALKEAPHSIMKLAALCLVSNKKLAEAYDSPNGVVEEIRRVEKLIGFQGQPGLPLEVIKEALPYIGLDALKNALTGLGGVLGALLPSEEQTPSIG